MAPANCLERDVLLAYHRGELPEDSADAVIEHLVGCPACQLIVNEFHGSEDAFLARLREPCQIDPYEDEPQRLMAVTRAFSVMDTPPTLTEEARCGIAPDPAMPAQWGEYELLERLDAGAMGVVYKARHTKLDRLAAIKVVCGHRVGDERIVARFYREMKAVGRVDHPNIVRALDARELEGRQALVMEYLAGLNMRTVIAQTGPLSVPDACEVIRQAALGLQCAHDNQLVHRDIKPSNLMLTPQGQIKILDLGLALLKAEESGEEMTRPGETVGTPDYIAPEQVANGHDVDHRVDIYSLGCTLYKLLSGRGPFAEYQGVVEKVIAHRQRVPTPIRRLQAEVPERLAAILDRMMAKNPSVRCATAEQVAEDMLAFTARSDLAGLLVRAARSPGLSAPQVAAGPWSIREVSPPRSRRWLVSLGACLAIPALIALGVVIWIGRTRVEVPEGSQVTITADGTMSVELPVPQPSPAPPIPVDPAVPTAGELAVIEPWFPGAEPGDTPPEPPPGPPPAFAHEDLHQFLVNTLKPLRTPQLWRMLYTEIATTIEQGEPGRPATWGIGGGLTNDGKPYEIAVRTGGWFPRILPPHEAAKQGIGPGTLSRNHAHIWRLPGNELVTLSAPELRLVNDRDGNHTLIGRIRCVAAARQSIEHLALVIEFPAENEDMTRRLYQQYRITEVPSGWLRVQLEINPAVNLKHAPRMYLQAFVARPKAGFFRISNELLWIQDGPSAP